MTAGNAMRYVSTRGRSPALDFDATLLAGLAEDGGLYMPERWPTLDLAALAPLGYAALAARVIEPFAAGAIEPAELAPLVADAYAGFDHPAVAPLVQIDHGLW
ncbi:MAG: threonine synthase, partial [Alphaproteobacteria bacterium]